MFPRESLGPVPAVDSVVSPPMSALYDAAFVVVTGVERLSKVGVSSASGALSTGVFPPSDIVLSLGSLRLLQSFLLVPSPVLFKFLFFSSLSFWHLFGF